MGVLGSEEIKGKQYISVYVDVFFFVFVDRVLVKLNRAGFVLFGCEDLLHFLVRWFIGNYYQSFHVELCSLDDGSEKDVSVCGI